MATTVTPDVQTTLRPARDDKARTAGGPVIRPTGFSLERRPDGRLWLIGDGRETPVNVTRCFPWSEPTRFFALRDPSDEEIAMVTSPSELDSDSRLALESALAEAGFVFQLVSVEEIEEEVELRCWNATTTQGPRRFQTRVDDWPRTLVDGRLLITDVAGDLYLLPSREFLGARSREVLWAFLD